MCLRREDRALMLDRMEDRTEDSRVRVLHNHNFIHNLILNRLYIHNHNHIHNLRYNHNLIPNLILNRKYNPHRILAQCLTHLFVRKSELLRAQ